MVIYVVDKVSKGCKFVSIMSSFLFSLVTKIQPTWLVSLHFCNIRNKRIKEHNISHIYFLCTLLDLVDLATVFDTLVVHPLSCVVLSLPKSFVPNLWNIHHLPSHVYIHSVCGTGTLKVSEGFICLFVY